jgi:cytoskeleton protein RodZ
MTSWRNRQQEETDVVTHLSPGKRLQKAREALHLSSEEVAAKLRLREGIILEIEEDRYTGLSPIYARGYIRAYARLVGLDPEGLVHAYTDLVGEAPVNLRSVTSPDIREAHEEISWGKWAAYTAGVILSAALLSWWQSREIEAPQPISSLAPELPEPAVEEKTLPLPELGPGAPEGAASSEPLPAQEEVPSSEASSAVTPAVPTAAPSPAEEMNSPVPETPLTEAVPEGVSPPVETPTQPSGSPLTGTGHRLVLELGGDSWNQVFDAQGNRLSYGLAKAGERLELVGEPPFKAVIGNAAEVTVRYDGNPVDITPYSLGGVARFTLEADGSLSP